MSTFLRFVKINLMNLTLFVEKSAFFNFFVLQKRMYFDEIWHGKGAFYFIFLIAGALVLAVHSAEPAASGTTSSP